MEGSRPADNWSSTSAASRVVPARVGGTGAGYLGGIRENRPVNPLAVPR